MNLSNKNVVHVVDGGIEYIQFKKLLEYEEIMHAYVLKPLDFKVRGEKDVIPPAYKKFLNCINVKYETLVRPRQMHTDKIVVVNEKENKDKPDFFNEYLDGVDGTITNKSEVTLATTNADCMLLIFFDPIKKVIANVHSGWRGTFKKISQVTIRKMKDEFGCDSSDIVVCICPSIRKCHFKVHDDVKDECEERFKYTGRIDEIIEKGEIDEEGQAYYIDTVLITKILLEEEGVLPENIIDSEICSVCNVSKINSKRGDGENYGLGAAIIKMQKQK